MAKNSTASKAMVTAQPKNTPRLMLKGPVWMSPSRICSTPKTTP